MCNSIPLFNRSFNLALTRWISDPSIPLRFGNSYCFCSFAALWVVYGSDAADGNHWIRAMAVSAKDDFPIVGEVAPREPQAQRVAWQLDQLDQLDQLGSSWSFDSQMAEMCHRYPEIPLEVLVRRLWSFSSFSGRLRQWGAAPWLENHDADLILGWSLSISQGYIKIKVSNSSSCAKGLWG